MLSFKLSDFSVIGGMKSLSPLNVIAFARARPVFRDFHGKMLIGDRYHSFEDVSGDEISESEWNDLQKSDEAFALKEPISPIYDGAFWIFRGVVPEDVEEMVSKFNQIGYYVDQIVDQRVWLIDEFFGNPLRVELAKRALTRGTDAVKRNAIAEAISEIQFCYAINPKVDPEVLESLRDLYNAL